MRRYALYRVPILVYIVMNTFFALNDIFDTELVHLYLSDCVQKSITYHYDPEMLSLVLS